MLAATLALMVGGAPLRAQTFYWNDLDTLFDNNVSDALNWLGASTPNSGADVVFNQLTASSSVVVNVPFTLNSVTFSNSTAYNVSGSGPLTIISAVTNASTSGSTTVISAPLILGGAVTVTESSSTSALVMTGGISGTGSLTVSNQSSTLLAALTGTGSTYSGNTAVILGTLSDLSANVYSPNSLMQIASGATLNVNFNESVNGLMNYSGGGGLVNVASGATLTDASNTTTTFSGVIIGNGGLAKTGTSSLILVGANTYTGDTTIGTGSAIYLGNGGTTGSIVSSSVSGGGSLSFNRSNALAYSGVISGAASVVQQGNGTTTLSGANTYSGATTLNNGVFADGAAGSFSPNSVVTLATGTALDVNFNETVPGLNGTGGIAVASGATLTENNTSLASYFFQGVVSGAGSFVKAGNGSFAFLADQTYTGGTTVTGGTLNIGSGGTAGSVIGNISTSGAVDFNRSTNLTYSGVVSGSGSFTKDGTNTLTLTNSSTYSGPTYVYNGILNLAATNTLPTTTVIQILSTGTLAVATNQSIAGFLGTDSGSSIIVAGGQALTTTSTSFNNSYDGVISGPGSLSVAGGAGGSLILTEPNTYTGGTTIASAATLTLGSGGSTGSIVGPVADNGTLVFNRSDTALSLGGAISGTGAVNQSSSGTATLAGANTYSGATNVFGGTLADGAAGSYSPNSVVSVSNGANLAVNFNETIDGLTGAGSTVLASGTTLTENHSTLPSTFFGYSGVISGAGALSLGGGNYYLSGTNTYTGGTTIGTGANLQLGNATASGSIAGPVVDNGKLSFSRSDASLTLTGIISGSGQVIQNSSVGGMATLSGANTYSGGTIVSTGTLADGAAGSFSPSSQVQIGTGGTLAVNFNETVAGLADYNGSSSGETIAIATGATLTDNLATSTSFLGIISGAGAIVKQGNGKLTLTGNSTYTGGTTILTGGSIQLGNGGTTGSIVGNVSDGQLLEFDRSDNITFAGAISGTGFVTQAGAGTLILTGANTYSGGTFITAGTVQIGNGGATGSLGTGTVSDAGQLVFDLSSSTSFGGAISGAGSLTKSGTGTVTLGGTNTYSGGTTVASGTLADSALAAFPSSGLMTVAPGATLSVNFNETSAGLRSGVTGSGGNVAIASGATYTLLNALSSEFGGLVSGAGSFAVSGAGMQTFTGADTYTGGTTIGSGAILQLGDSSASLNGSVAGTIVDNGTLILNDFSAATIGNSISGSGSLLVNSGAMYTFASANTYTGGTTVTNGVVQVANATGSALGTSTVSVVGSGSTRGVLTGSGSFSGPLILALGGRVYPGFYGTTWAPATLSVGLTSFSGGSSTGFGFAINNATGSAGSNWSLLSVNGLLTISASASSPFEIDLNSLTITNVIGSTANFNATSPYSWMFVQTTGGITGFAASDFSFNLSATGEPGFLNATNGGAFYVTQVGNALYLNFAPVPEPSTWVLLLVGGAALIFVSNRSPGARSKAHMSKAEEADEGVITN